MIRHSIVALAVALCVLSCGGPLLTPQTACEEQIDAQCEKMWTCSNPGLKIGSNQASCKTSYKSLCALAAGGCEAGKTFDANNAAACNPALKAQTCEQFQMGAPDVCKNQCK